MSALATDTALRRSVLALAGAHAELWHHTITPWQSITFSGERHRLRLKLADQDQVDVVVGCIDRDELCLPGRLVADVGVVEIDSAPAHVWLTIDLLLLFEGCAT